MRIDTPRLFIKSLEAADAVPLARIWADPQVTRYMGGPRDYERVRALLEDRASLANPPEFDLWPVVEKASGKVIGDCGLLQKEVDGKPEVEVNYVFDPSVWGKGYATEAASALVNYAFTQLGLKHLIALIDPENVASQRVALKLGMRLEKETVRPGGTVRHVYVVEAGEEDGVGC